MRASRLLVLSVPLALGAAGCLSDAPEKTAQVSSQFFEPAPPGRTTIGALQSIPT